MPAKVIIILDNPTPFPRSLMHAFFCRFYARPFKLFLELIHVFQRLGGSKLREKSVAIQLDFYQNHSTFLHFVICNLNKFQKAFTVIMEQKATSHSLNASLVPYLNKTTI